MIEWSAYHYLHELRESREIETLEHKKSIKIEHRWRQKLRAGLWGCNFSRRRRLLDHIVLCCRLGIKKAHWCRDAVHRCVCVWEARRGGEQEASHRSNPTPRRSQHRRRTRTTIRPPQPSKSCRRRQRHAREKKSKWQQVVGRVVTDMWVNGSGVDAGGSVGLLVPDWDACWFGWANLSARV
jgi:hypothetical protein